MSALVFGNYLTNGERDSFEVGHVPTLDGIDGFFDTWFESGKSLFFLVSDRELSSASEVAFADPARFRDLLNEAPMVTGTVLDGGHSARFRVERSEPFLEINERRARPGSNEILDEVDRYDRVWSGVRDALQRMGDRYLYGVGCDLPSLAAIRECLRQGLVGTKRRWDTTMLLEARPKEQIVRVVVYGSHDLDSSRIFDIVDPDEYQSAIQERARAARLEREARFWSSLIEG